MKRTLVVVSLLLASTTLVIAQTKNPVSSVLQQILPRQEKNIMAAVEEMPADKYSFQPTPAQMTFGHLVEHMVDSNLELCAQVGDMAPPPKVSNVNEKAGKDRLVAALRKSFDFCDLAVGKADDSKLGDTVELYGGHKGPRAFVFFALTNDWTDHYTMAAMYLRLNGLLPPTAQPKK